MSTKWFHGFFGGLKNTYLGIEYPPWYYTYNLWVAHFERELAITFLGALDMKVYASLYLFGTRIGTTTTKIGPYSWSVPYRSWMTGWLYKELLIQNAIKTCSGHVIKPQQVDTPWLVIIYKVMDNISAQSKTLCRKNLVMLVTVEDFIQVFLCLFQRFQSTFPLSNQIPETCSALDLHNIKISINEN